MSDNPFQTPHADVRDADQSYADIHLFGFAGRMGRLRYLSYSFVSALVIYMGLGIVVGILAAIFIPMLAKSGGNTLAEILFVLVYLTIVVAVLVVQAQYGVRRLHDLNLSGWLWLIILIPLVNFFFALYLLFFPGSESANDYGLPPPPNTTGVWIGALGVPFFMCAVFGILAAIAIPQYQEFKTRGEGAGASAEFRNLANELVASSLSREESGQFLATLRQEAGTRYPNLQFAVGDNEIQVRFRKPQQWRPVRLTLARQDNQDTPAWTCRAEGQSTKNNDRMFQNLLQRCQKMGG